MATPAVHSLKFDQVRNFGQLSGEFALSDLTQIQTESYLRFLQLDADPKHRKPHGLEEIMREIFPISSYDGQHKLDFRSEADSDRIVPAFFAARCRSETSQAARSRRDHARDLPDFEL